MRQEDAAVVKIGQPVRFRTDDNLQEAVGNISWISSTIDPRTRTPIWALMLMVVPALFISALYCYNIFGFQSLTLVSSLKK